MNLIEFPSQDQCGMSNHPAKLKPPTPEKIRQDNASGERQETPANAGSAGAASG